MPDNGSAADGATQRQAYDVVVGAFGPGFNGPLLVLAESGRADAAARELSTVPGVVAVSPPQVKGQRALIQVVPATGPQDEATENLVAEIRERASGIEQRTGSRIAVTGPTAIGIDVSERLRASLPPFVAVVVGLSLLLLLVFRSIVVPIKATAGFLLSVGASFGAVVAVFQWGWLADLLGVAHTGPVVSFLSVILIAVLFGLAMDYEVFLVSSMREEWLRTGQARAAVVGGAVVGGARHASHVVTSAALIMFSVFASFVTTHDATIKPIAFALAFGVLVDAFLIRMMFVPAVLSLVGRGAWWLPGWLDRLLPDLDLQGTRAEPAPGYGVNSHVTV